MTIEVFGTKTVLFLNTVTFDIDRDFLIIRLKKGFVLNLVTSNNVVRFIMFNSFISERVFSNNKILILKEWFHYIMGIVKDRNWDGVAGHKQERQRKTDTTGAVYQVRYVLKFVS